MRRVAVVSVGRSDFGILTPVLRRIQQDPELQLRLIVSGAHLSPAFGSTVSEILDAGFEIAERIDMLLSSDTPAAVATSMGLGTIGFAQAYARLRPDIIVLLGDRFEMHTAAAAAAPFCVPLAHIHGGEVTEGAIDDAFRHAITKYSHLHFATTKEHAARIVQLGEEPQRVIVSGAPSLDGLRQMTLLSLPEIEKQLELSLGRPPLLVTYHPVTLQHQQTERQTQQFLDALNEFDGPIVVTLPNADTGRHTIIRMIREFEDRRSNVRVVENLGTQCYFSLMAVAAAMAGNSSSGIIEAASFKLPVVNVGDRQKGRLHERNVVDTGESREEIQVALRKVLSREFRKSLTELKNPYGDGNAARIIVDTLKRVEPGPRLLMKQFHDIRLQRVAA